MTTTIAVAGKGGTGKTTVAALLIYKLSRKGSVLAIDADPSCNLNLALGLPQVETIGGVREEMLAEVRTGRFPPGVAKQDYLELRLREALVESEKVDLLAMGRPEGPGCYCAANSMLRSSIDRLAQAYDYVVIDNEAGMEHISRQTTRDVDVLIILTDATMRGVTTARRMKELIGELRTSVGRTALVVNRAGNGLHPQLTKAIAEAGLEVVATIPEDPNLAELEVRGEPVIRLPEHSPLPQAIETIMAKLGLA